MENLIKRTLTSVGIVLGIVLAIYSHSDVLFGFVFGIAGLIAVCEFHKITKSNKVAVRFSCLLFILMFASVYFFNLPVFYYIIALYGLVLLLTLASVIFVSPTNFLTYLGNILISQIWITFPFTLLHFMNISDDFSPHFLMALFILIWCNDVGGYVVGSFVGSKRKDGNHKMCPAISPGKSWEGVAGGLFFSLIGVFICATMCDTLSLLQWMVLMPIVTCFGILGDLTESCLKRTVDTKDAGSILPGHGGILDRCDSMLFVVPISALYVLVITKIFA